MDVLTESQFRSTARSKLGPADSRIYLFAAGVLYAISGYAAALHHEPWADEAQSWMLARDASLADLWTRLLHYEGTPGLWQTLLHWLIRTGLPYSGFNVMSVSIGLAAACLLLWRAPFPLAIRATLPFTFFLCYQYAVIARSYDLLPLLVFACAAIFHEAAGYAPMFAGLLCLMSAVSVHGMVVAFAIAAAAAIRYPRPRLLGYLGVFAGVSALLAAFAWPASDGVFVTGLNYSPGHFLEVSRKALAAAFTGELFSSLLVIALSLPLLWRGGGWLFFVLSTVGLCVIDAVIYSQVWHYGALFLAWLFAVWISYRRALAARLFWLAITIVIAVQVYWTGCAIAYDWKHEYSASRSAAQGLRELDLTGKKLYAIGFACVAIEPYFPRNVFANFNDGRPEGYWDWSRRNHVNDDSLHLAQSRPDYVIIGYKNDFEKGVWEDLAGKAGYGQIRHFEGNSFWQSRAFEPESYDLYQRSAAP